MQPSAVTGLVAVAALAAGLLVLLTTIDSAEAQLCPLCECPPAYKPICGVTRDNNGRRKMRGFPSRCVMECSNQCRKAQYVFMKKGRCGPKVLKTTEKPVVTSENSAMDKGASTVSSLPLKAVPPE